MSTLDAKTAHGDTPMYPALDGATAWAIQRKLAHPDEDVAVVLLTDGVATTCNTSPTDIAALAGNAFEGYGVRVHAIGFGNGSPANIQQIASAGGGGAYFMTATGAILESSMITALRAIRGDSTMCDVPLPQGGISDPSLVTVRLAPGGGAQTMLSKLADVASCGDGWYANGAVAKLCPATCAAARVSGAARVVATVPCN